MGKCLRKLLKSVVNDNSQVLPILVESVSEVSCFILEPINFAEVTRLSEDIKKCWLQESMKEIRILIINQTFLVQEPEKDEPMNPCMNVYKGTN